MSNRLLVLLAIPVVFAFTVGATSCGPPHPPPGGTSLTITAYRDDSNYGGFNGAPSFDLDNSWGSPGVPILVGHVNSCINTFLDSGYRGACRVVNGYNGGDPSSAPALRDHTQWDVKIIAGHPKAFIRNPGFGYQLSTYFSPFCQGSCAPNHGINSFEGCQKVASWDGVWPLHSAATSTDEFICDYAVYDWAFTQPANPASWWEHVAYALWPDAVLHNGDDAACGWAVGALVTGDVPGFLATVYGCRVELQNPNSSSAPSLAPTDGSPPSLPTSNVLPGDPAQPGDPTPDLPAGSLTVSNPLESP